MIVPFAAGGAADALPRIAGERLAARWGQPFIIMKEDAVRWRDVIHAAGVKPEQ